MDTTALAAVAEGWLTEADALDAEPGRQDETVVDHDGELDDAVNTQDAYRLRRCAADLLGALGLIDVESSSSRQHYIDTGRYLYLAERWCEMVPDGTDTNGDEWNRCTVHGHLVLGDAYVCEGYVAPAYQGGK